MIPVVYKVITLASCGSIVFMGLFLAINRMGPNTSHVVRMAWILITCGAFGVGLTQIVGHVPVPSAAQTMDWFGTAMFLAFDRRNYFVPKHPRPTLVKTQDSAN
jgi:hypothetical protein